MKSKIFAMFLSKLQFDTTLRYHHQNIKIQRKRGMTSRLQSVVFVRYAVLRHKPHNLNSVASRNFGLLQTQLSLICRRVLLFKIAIGNRIYLYCLNRLQDECLIIKILRANHLVLKHQGCRNPRALSLQKVIDPKATTAPALALKITLESVG